MTSTWTDAPKAVEVTTMALFMDVHVTLPAGRPRTTFAAAHRADLDVQQRHGVRYLRYWVDEEARCSASLRP
jgi:hypothetical protein